MKTLGSHSLSKSFSGIRISLLIYFLLSVGMLLQISGSNWDIVWHGIGNVETFFTPPHSVIYSGVALAIGSIIWGFVQTANIIRQQKKDAMWFISVPLSLPFSLRLATMGCILQLSAGPLDFWWHSQFGFDGLLSPPHSVLAVGMLMAALGALIGIYSHYKINNRIPFILSSIVAVIMIIQSTTTITSNSYFTWLFPLYLLNIIPAIVTDILILHLFDKRRNKGGARKTSIMNCYVAASVIVSIFYTTLFFPWTVDVYGGYFEPPDTLRTEQFLVQLMIPVVLPITVPISIVSSLAGGLVAQILTKTKILNIMVLS